MFHNYLSDVVKSLFLGTRSRPPVVTGGASLIPLLVSRVRSREINVLTTSIVKMISLTVLPRERSARGTAKP